MIEAGTHKRDLLIWALLGGRRGDDAQVLALAEALGGTVQAKPLAYTRLFSMPNLLLGESLATLERHSAVTLAAPWPDLVIGVGRRSVPAARWIRKSSGGRARLVQIGRPRAPLAWFDLVLTTPQYGLPESPNVLQTMLPLVRRTVAEGAAAERWAAVFAALPRPWIGVLVGGTRAPYRFDRAQAERLAREASALATRLGGSLLVSTSPRTGKGATEALTQAIGAPAHMHAWSGAGDNPHAAILALAERFVVTADTVSMLAEACLTAKPVDLFMPARQWLPAWSARRGLARRLGESGILSPPRDPRAVCERLIAGGHAAILGGSAERTHVPAPDEMPRVVEAVRRLFDGAAPRADRP